MATGSRPRILVVDDDAAIIATFKSILHGEGFDVATATDGTQAVARARREHFDVILLDLVMPGMDGLVTLRELRQVVPDTRVVILSAYIEPDREAEAFRLGAVAVLPKPPELQKLLRFLHELARPERSGESERT
ncbi:MAG TPA: response regulator [Methylomirabilota bacterium]|jgi:CheY-like chemotaxis protein|nr:response regulator [Methylomirabilota bacterium]